MTGEGGVGGVKDMELGWSVGGVVPESVVSRRNVLLDGRVVASSDRDKTGTHIDDCFVSQLKVIDQN